MTRKFHVYLVAKVAEAVLVAVEGAEDTLTGKHLCEVLGPQGRGLIHPALQVDLVQQLVEVKIRLCAVLVPQTPAFFCKGGDLPAAAAILHSFGTWNQTCAE